MQGCIEEHKSDEDHGRRIRQLMHNNATSVVVTSREVYPHLKKAGGGLIVNIGSFFDKMGVKRSVAYCASKAAIGAITRCLAVEWAARQHSRHRRGAGLYRDRPQRRIPRERSVWQWIDRRIPVTARASRRRWHAGRRPCSSPTSASSPARPSTSTAARACIIDDRPAMKIFDQLERRRTWSRRSRLLLDAVRRVADEVIAPEAAGFDKSGEFPWDNVKAHQRARAQRRCSCRRPMAAALRRYKLYLAVREDHLQGLRLHRHHLRHQLPRA